MPWLDKEEEAGWILHAFFDICVVGHSEDGCLTLGILDNIEFYIGHDRRIGVSFAVPDWLSLPAIEAEIVEILDNLNERLFRNHSQAHSIIEDDLLSVFGELLTIVVHTLSVCGPIELIAFGLVHPDQRCVFLGVFFEIITTKGDIAGALIVV